MNPSGAAASVRIEALGANQRIVGAVLASLPRSFERAPGGDVLALCGEGNWPERALAAIESGVRAILVTEPSPTSTSRVDVLVEAATARGVPLRLARQWADDPAVGPFSAALRADTGSPVLVDLHAAVAEDTTHHEALTAQLDLLSEVFGVRVAIDSISASPHGYGAVGTLGDETALAPLVLSAVRSRAASPMMSLRRLTERGRERLELFGAWSARPGTARVGNDEGELLLPTVYETGHRAAWRELREDLDGRRADMAPLVRFARSSERALLALSGSARTTDEPVIASGHTTKGRDT